MLSEFSTEHQDTSFVEDQDDQATLTNHDAMMF